MASLRPEVLLTLTLMMKNGHGAMRLAKMEQVYLSSVESLLMPILWPITRR